MEETKMRREIMFSREEKRKIIDTIQNLIDIYRLEMEDLKKEMEDNDEDIDYFIKKRDEDSRDSCIELERILQDLYDRLDLLVEEMKDHIIEIEDYWKTQKELE